METSQSKRAGGWRVVPVGQEPEPDAGRIQLPLASRVGDAIVRETGKGDRR